MLSTFFCLFVLVWFGLVLFLFCFFQTNSVSGLHRSSETGKNVVTGPVSQPSLVQLKDRGGLVSPFPSAISVCQETEKSVQRMSHISGLRKGGGLVGAIATSVLEHSRDKQLLPSLESHMLHCTPTTNHGFLGVFFFFVDKLCGPAWGQETQKITGDRVRKQHPKLILFKL